MHRLGRVGDRFRMKLRKVTGAEFYGQLLDIPDTSRVSNFLTPRRYLRTTPTTTVVPRDVIIANNVKFIVAEHGDGFYTEVIYKHFKLFEVTHTYNWKRKSFVKNTITGIMEEVLTNDATVVYVSLQPKAAIEDTMNIAQQTYTAISNLDIARGEVIANKYVVTRSYEVLGVFLLEMKEK